MCIINRAAALLRELDLNQRPSDYEPDELPSVPSRDMELCNITISIQYLQLQSKNVSKIALFLPAFAAYRLFE